MMMRSIVKVVIACEVMRMAVGMCGESRLSKSSECNEENPVTHEVLRGLEPSVPARSVVAD